MKLPENFDQIKEIDDIIDDARSVENDASVETKSSNQFFETSAIPASLKELKQWTLWRKEMRDGKVTKLPCVFENGRLVNRKKEHPLYSYADAVALARKHNCGIGIFFAPMLSSLCGVDLDDCLDERGDIKPWAKKVLDAVGNTYTEISPSARGLHVLIFDADITPLKKKRKGDLEMYREGRYFTVTGKPFGETADVADKHGILTALCNRFLMPPSNDEAAITLGTDAPKDEPSKAERPMLKVDASAWPTELNEYFDRIRQSVQYQKFFALHQGITAGYKSPSEARLAYFAILAFYTNKNAELMRRAFDCSELAKDPGVDERKLNLDINKAIETCKGVYTGKREGGDGRSDGRKKGGSARKVDTSDYGIADAIVHSSVGNQLRYHRELGSFMIYDNPIWRVLNKDAEVRFLIARYRQTLDPDDDEEILGNLTSEKKVPKVISALRNFPELIVGADDLNNETMLINCKNGVVDLKTATLVEHSPAHMWTKCADVIFDPDATSDIWNHFITSIIPDDATRQALQIYLGYCLTGSVEEEKALFIHGSGGNGKGTLLGTLTVLLGDYATPFKIDAVLQGQRSEAQAATPEFNKLEHARLAYAEEIPPDRKLDVAQFKILTGGDRLPIRRLHHEATQIKQPSHKMIFSGNRLPKLDDPRDQGILRRLLVVEFRNSFTDQNRDPTLKKKLTREEVKSAIFNWLLQGCLEWQRRREQNGSGLPVSEEMKKDRDAYLIENDELMYFIDENCVRDKNASVKRSEMLKRIKAEVNSLRQTSDQELTKLLLSIDGITYGKKTTGRVFYGIRLLDPSELEGFGDPPPPSSNDEIPPPTVE